MSVKLLTVEATGKKKKVEMLSSIKIGSLTNILYLL